MYKNIFLWVSLLLFTYSCNGQPITKKNQTTNPSKKDSTMEKLENEIAVFGAGCFWCVEAVFQRVPGVLTLESGYSGGDLKNPSYKEICSGLTGHAEVIKISYNPAIVSYNTLLSVFWQTHDPTTLNKQGADEGTQYRSVIFYTNESQKTSAEQIKEELDKSGAFSAKIVTEIAPLKNYYPAEAYHQNYYNQNTDQSYCRFVIAPKLEKFEKVFGEQFRKK